MSFGFIDPKHFYINLAVQSSILSVHDEGYSRNAVGTNFNIYVLLTVTV